MSHHYRTGLSLSLAGLALALGGCAALENSTTADASTATMGSRASGFMQAGYQPFSLTSCMKFEAVPYECEGVVNRGE